MNAETVSRTIGSCLPQIPNEKSLRALSPVGFCRMGVVIKLRGNEESVSKD